MAHNAHVDVAVLRRELGGWESPEVFDTLKLASGCSRARQLQARRAGQGAVTGLTGLPPGLEPHRAAYDVLVTARLFVRLATRHDGSPLSLDELRGQTGDQKPEAPMRLRPFSSRERGMFVSVDGPSGAGKSTIVHHLAQMLVAAGETRAHHGRAVKRARSACLCRELTESVTGHALACLYAADRYHHVQTEIRPHTESGQTVISDRYIPSGLVMQRFDGIDPSFLWQLNAEADRPDLAVILEADPETIAERLPSAVRITASSSRPAAVTPRLISTGRRLKA